MAKVSGSIFQYLFYNCQHRMPLAARCIEELPVFDYRLIFTLIWSVSHWYVNTVMLNLWVSWGEHGVHSYCTLSRPFIPTILLQMYWRRLYKFCPVHVCQSLNCCVTHLKVSLSFQIIKFHNKKFFFNELAYIYYDKCFLCRNLCWVLKKRKKNFQIAGKY